MGHLQGLHNIGRGLLNRITDFLAWLSESETDVAVDVVNASIDFHYYKEDKYEPSAPPIIGRTNFVDDIKVFPNAHFPLSTVPGVAAISKQNSGTHPSSGLKSLMLILRVKKV